jgi:hypothetical protein
MSTRWKVWTIQNLVNRNKIPESGKALYQAITINEPTEHLGKLRNWPFEAEARLNKI